MNMFSQSIEKIEKQLNEFKSVLNYLDNNSNVDKDYHTMHVLASRRKVCEFTTSLYNTEYKLKQMLNRIESIKQDVNNAVDIVNEYTNGKEKENVHMVCSKIPIKTLTKAHILDNIFTPAEVCYMANKKLTKKIISKLEFNDLSYVLSSCVKKEKADMLIDTMAENFKTWFEISHLSPEARDLIVHYRINKIKETYLSKYSKKEIIERITALNLLYHLR